MENDGENKADLEKSKYSIKPMTEVDLEKVLRWRNSDRVRRNMYTQHKITWGEHQKWFQQCSKSEEVKNLLFYINNEAVGVVNITDIDASNSSCTWSIYIGDEKAPQGSGYKMGQAAIEYIFKELGLRKIRVEVLIENVSSLNFHKKLGFQEQCRTKSHVMKDSTIKDIYILVRTRESFDEQNNEEYHCIQ